MKKLKLDHQLAAAIVAGQKTSTWRMFDDKDLQVDDHVLLIDKVDPGQPDSWKPIGVAAIDRITERRLADITDAELDGREGFTSREEMIEQYRRYYGSNVTWQTPLKVVDFHFSPQIPSGFTQHQTPERAILYADGGSRGNPGPSAAGYVLYDEARRVLATGGIYIGVTTNNQAEYTALKLGLEAAKRAGARDVHVYMDSMLVVNQMRGIFKVKNRDLWPVHQAAKELCAGFRRVDFTQIPRELNKIADRAVNDALDAHADGQPPAASGTNTSSMV